MSDQRLPFFQQFLMAHDLSEFWYWVREGSFQYIAEDQLGVYLPLSLDDLVASCSMVLYSLIDTDSVYVQNVKYGEPSAQECYFRTELDNAVLWIKLFVIPDTDLSGIQLQIGQPSSSDLLTPPAASLLAACINALAREIAGCWACRRGTRHMVTFGLHTTNERFGHWLDNQITSFLEGMGADRRIILQPPHIRRMNEKPHRYRITIEGRKVAPMDDLIETVAESSQSDTTSTAPNESPTRDNQAEPDSQSPKRKRAITREQVGLLFEAIEFIVDELASERIEVRATCHEPDVCRRFCALLHGIAQTWPEAADAIFPLHKSVSLPQPEERTAAAAQPADLSTEELLGDKKPRRPRRHRGPEPLDEWQRHMVEAWRAARKRGVRQKDFCNQNGIDRRQLYRWDKKYDTERT